MTEAVPVYSTDPILRVIEEAGHDIHVAADKIAEVATKVPAVIKLAEEVKADADTVIPGIVLVLQDAVALEGDATVDAAQSIAALTPILSPLAVAIGSENPVTIGEAVVSLITQFPTLVTTLKTFANLAPALGKLIVDSKTLKADALAAWETIETDAQAV
jgi:hypothetical protein